jgi:hypothetical protein
MEIPVAVLSEQCEALLRSALIDRRHNQAFVQTLRTPVDGLAGRCLRRLNVKHEFYGAPHPPSG